MSESQAPIVDAPQKTINPLEGVRPSKKQREAERAAQAAPPKPAAQAPTDPKPQHSDATTDVAPKDKAPGSPDEPDKAPGSPDEPVGDAPKPKTLKEFAQSVGVDPKELYALEVPYGDNGETMSLGDIKDVYKELAPNIERLREVDRLEVQHRVERSNLIRDLDNLVKLLPPQALKPEYIVAVQQQAKIMAQAEMGKLVQIFPEWQNPLQYEVAVTDMVGVANNYGLTPDEVGNIIDHRWIQALYDLAQYRKRESAAHSALKVPPKAAKLAASTNPARLASGSELKQREQAKKGNKSAQSNLVAGLLKNNLRK